jgi:hypothetical protein
MKKLIFHFFTLVLSMSFSAFAQNAGQAANRIQLQEKCIDVKNDMTEATVAEDWGRLFLVANRYISTCGDVWGRKWLGDAYEKRALVYLRTDKPKQQLVAADECLAIHYGNIACHLHRSEGLIDRKTFRESRVSVKRAENLIAFELESERRKLQTYQTDLDRRQSQATIRELESFQGWASSITRLINVLE